MSPRTFARTYHDVAESFLLCSSAGSLLRDTQGINHDKHKAKSSNQETSPEYSCLCIAVTLPDSRTLTGHTATSCPLPLALRSPNHVMLPRSAALCSPPLFSLKCFPSSDPHKSQKPICLEIRAPDNLALMGTFSS